MLKKSTLSRAMTIVAVLACSSAYARELDKYLMEPADLPSGCQRIQELFPLNDKVSKFYEGKVYRSVVPAPIDRHAQSFDCGGQKGTLYFYQYPTLNDKEQALLFARPVLTQTEGAPRVADWRDGFVVLSFAQMPEALRQHLLEKIGDGQTVSSSATTPVTPSTMTPVVTSTTSPVPSTPAVVQSTETPVALPVSPPSPLPPTAAVPATVSTGVAPSIPARETPNDISNEVLTKIRKSIDCRDRTLPVELIQVCDWIEAFRKGKTAAPVIASTDTRIGLGYRVDGYGRLDREYYQVATGSGVTGEIGLVPLYPANGVEELELRAMATGSPHQRPIPSNEITRRIASASRPTYRTFMPTDGKSWLALRPDQTLYLRRSGKQWIILGLDNKTDESSEHYDFTLTSFQ